MLRKSKAELRIATCQFAEDWNPSRNAGIVRRYIIKAAAAGADVVHFHEAALSGYGGAIGKKSYDWAALRQATQSVLEQASESGVWVVLGSSHPLGKPHRPHNSLYIISPDGRIVDRYDKRFCTGGDLESYTSGDHFVTFKIKGLLCSALICYDVRFPELYRQLALMGVRVVFHSFHNARAKRNGIHGRIMRQTLQAHAGINHVWISAPNSAADFSSWPGVFITPDGLIAKQLPHNRPGMMVNSANPSIDYYDASDPYRDRAIRGILHSGKLVNDPRSTDRTCY